MLRAWQKLLEPIRRRLAQIVTRAVLLGADDRPGLQEAQIKALADEVMDRIERFQNYGFSSVPLPGAEGLFLAPGACRSNGVLVCVDDRRWRIKGLRGGEVAVYTDEDQGADGCRIVLKRGNRIEIQARDIDIRAENRLHLSGREVEIHGDERLETDVQGYGEAVNFGSGGYTIDTYHTGAAPLTSTEHGIKPPEVP